MITENLLFMGTTIVSFIVWLVRLEGRVNYNDEANRNTQTDVDDLRGRVESLDSKIMEQLSDVRESLARIEGHMGLGSNK